MPSSLKSDAPVAVFDPVAGEVTSAMRPMARPPVNASARVRSWSVPIEEGFAEVNTGSAVLAARVKFDNLAVSAASIKFDNLAVPSASIKFDNLAVSAVWIKFDHLAVSAAWLEFVNSAEFRGTGVPPMIKRGPSMETWISEPLELAEALGAVGQFVWVEFSVWMDTGVLAFVLVPNSQ